MTQKYHRKILGNDVTVLDLFVAAITPIYALYKFTIYALKSET